MIEVDWFLNFGYYCTYLGDIYYGRAIYPNSEDRSFYILSENKLKDYLALQETEKHLEHLDKLGIYIKNKEIIQEWIPKDKFPMSKKDFINPPWPGKPASYKRMFIFGAGASYSPVLKEGAEIIKNFKYRPPLGTQIFDARFKEYILKYQGLRRIIPKFEQNGNDIERVFEDDWSELISKKNLKLASQHIQAQFYLQELFQKISFEVENEIYRHNLYSLFAEKLSKSLSPESKVSIVSFNYDTLLENSLGDYLNFPLKKMSDYIDKGEKSHLLLFKPHGSCNWGWQFDTTKIPEDQNISNWIYEQGFSPAEIYYSLLGPDMISQNSYGIEMSNHEHRIGRYSPNRDLIKVIENNKQYFPALLIPYRDKDEFIMPYGHQICMENIMKSAEELVIIGWKGNEKLFNKKLKERAKGLKRIIVVNPNFDEVVKELTKYFDLSTSEIIPINDFEDYVLRFEEFHV